jgi:hypothetical protein
MFARKIVVSPDLVIRIRVHPTRRQRALRALLPKAVAWCLGSVCLLMVLASV